MKTLKRSSYRLGLASVILSLAALACNLGGVGAPTPAPTQEPLPPTPTAFKVGPNLATEIAATSNAPLPVAEPLAISSGGPLKVGVMGSQTGQTVDASSAVQAGVEAAVQEHGPVAGLPIELVQFDSKCSESGGQIAAQEAAGTANLAAIIGPTCSNAARGALPVLESHLVVTVSASATLPEVASYGPTVFNRVILHEDQPGSSEGAEVEDLESVQSFYDRLDSELASENRYFSAYGYDAATLLMQSLEQVAEPTAEGGLTIDRAALARQVRNTTGFEGVTGTITFDEAGNRVP